MYDVDIFIFLFVSLIFNEVFYVVYGE